jgi:Phosphopantetheine attachment site
MTNVTDQTRADAPTTATEAAVADMWTELLDVPEVGPGDDFFQLGATSLTAIKFLQRVETMFGRDVLVPDTLYEDPRLASVAAAIDEALASRSPS